MWLSLIKSLKSLTSLGLYIDGVLSLGRDCLKHGTKHHNWDKIQSLDNNNSKITSKMEHYIPSYILHLIGA